MIAAGKRPFSGGTIRMEATVLIQARIGEDEGKALEKIVSPRGKNKYLRELVRADLIKRGVLKPAAAADKR